MRSFFWLLVLVNAAYFGWKQFGADAGEQIDLTVQEEKPTLMLIEELAAQPEPRVANNALSAPVQVPEDAQATQSVSALENADLEQEGSAVAVAVPAMQSQPLLSIPKAVEEISRVCSVVAGFATSDPALELVRTLKEAEVESYTLSGDESAAVVYWVYLPKFSSPELARSTLAELRAKGIDSFYLDSGELAGGISLGVFTRREGALRTQEELVRRGYAASIQEVARTATRFRVVVESTREALMAEAGMQKFLENNPGLDVSDFVCEGVAEQN